MSSVQRKPKSLLTAEQKYDLWVRMLCGQITQAQAAAEAGVDRSVISRLRAVARDGAVAALGSSRPGRPRQSRAEASEAAALRAEVERPWGGPWSSRPSGTVCGGVEMLVGDELVHRRRAAAAVDGRRLKAVLPFGVDRRRRRGGLERF